MYLICLINFLILNRKIIEMSNFINVIKLSLSSTSLSLPLTIISYIYIYIYIKAEFQLRPMWINILKSFTFYGLIIKSMMKMRLNSEIKL